MRTIAVSLPLLTLGLAAGFVRLRERGGGFDALMAVTVVTWLGLVFLVQRARLSRPNNATVALGLLLATVAGYPIWGPRAQMVTFALTSLVLLLVERHLRRGGSSPASPYCGVGRHCRHRLSWSTVLTD